MKKTYGLGLNDKNPVDAALMAQLEPMPRGQRAEVIRAALCAFFGREYQAPAISVVQVVQAAPAASGRPARPAREADQVITADELAAYREAQTAEPTEEEKPRAWDLEPVEPHEPIDFQQFAINASKAFRPGFRLAD